MIILGFISIVIIGIGLVYINKKTISNTNLFTQQYFIIESYLHKNLNLEESIYFIDLVRRFNLDLISFIQGSSLPTTVTKFTHELLGLILKIPRMEENNDNKDILIAIRQINTITETTLEIQQFLIKNLPSQRKYILK